MTKTTKYRYRILYKNPTDKNQEEYREIIVNATDAKTAINQLTKKFATRKGGAQLKTDDLHCYRVRNPHPGRPHKTTTAK